MKQLSLYLIGSFQEVQQYQHEPKQSKCEARAKRAPPILIVFIDFAIVLLHFGFVYVLSFFIVLAHVGINLLHLGLVVNHV